MNDQKIKCTVTTCKYNDWQRQGCNLESIIVTPCSDIVEEKEESMCSSYKFDEE